jgi:uncharacterized protein (TIGR02391 family)
LKKRGQPTCAADFDNAAFEAMKAVEIAVRDAAGYGPEKIGVNLIQDAFSQGKGPLTDTTVPSEEQVSRMNLFWAAIGSYKNPQSHRDGLWMKNECDSNGVSRDIRPDFLRLIQITRALNIRMAALQ